VVVLGVATLQVLVLLGRGAAARRATSTRARAACLWFAGAALLFAVFMYGVAELLASRIPVQEEYIAATAPRWPSSRGSSQGALFPISALPGALTAFAKVLPLNTRPWRSCATACLVTAGAGLHDIWGHGQHDRHGRAQPRSGGAVRGGALTAIAIRAFLPLRACAEDQSPKLSAELAELRA